jgi:hypothetical protein
MPFGRAAQELQHFRGVAVSRSTVERLTEAAGAAYVRCQTAEVARIAKALPVPPAGPAQQFLSVDGAMVPLVGGEWAEVKTLVIGEVQPAVIEKGEPVVHTTQLSYFSRLSDAETFQRLALVETQRRGVETAQAVAAVTDGAEWIQKFVDQHRHDAVRILDFPHAAEHLNAVGQAVFGEGTPAAQAWLAAQLHGLKHAGPSAVLTAVQALVSQHPEQTELASQLAYLKKRAAHMRYPEFQAAGWPIGAGAVESGNKLVVEARLKGSGMHWARSHVNALLALRNIVCSDRWAEAWPHITQTLRQQRQRHRRTPSTQRRPAPAPTPVLTAQPVKPTAAPPAPSLARPAAPEPSAKQPATEPRRPPANHPWRRMPIGRARFKLPFNDADAKT